MSVLHAFHLKKYYGSAENLVKALDDVSVSVEDGQFAAIVGTSGSGKSTLLNMLGGLDTPTSGSVQVEDKTLETLTEEQLTVFRRQRIGFIFQNYNLIPYLTAYENIVLPVRLDGRSEDKDFLEEIVHFLELDGKLSNYPSHLSGGQQQRVAIARALATKPAIILADEPTGNLDEENSINVCNILRKLANDILVVVVSHEQEIADWADRVITMLDGKILSDEAGKAMPEKQLERDENSLSDSEVAELIRQKNQKGEKTGEFFSFKNKPKTAKKKKGLSAKSSVGLSLALLNKDIAKKVCLTIVMIILISVMVLSVSMSFATSEKTLANAINNLNGDKKLFEVAYVVGKPLQIWGRTFVCFQGN